MTPGNGTSQYNRPPESERTRTDNFSSREIRENVDNLRDNTVETALLNAGTRSDLMIAQTGMESEQNLHTLDGFLSAIDNLIAGIEDTKKGISKKGLTKAGKETMKEAKVKLKQYEKQLKTKRKKLIKGGEGSEIFESDIMALKNTWEQINRIREDIGRGQWGEFSNSASFLYNSPETARKSNRRQEKINQFEQKMKEEIKQGAILNIFNGHEEAAMNFYRMIAEGRYTQAEYSKYVENAGILDPSLQRCGVQVPLAAPGQLTGGSSLEQGSQSGTVDYSNMDWGETFQRGGLSGIIDKGLSYCKNMTPGQRNTWKNIAVLGGFAAGIFGLYKFFTSKKISLLGKAGITGLTIFGSQALTGENPITLFRKLMTGGFSVDELKEKFGNTFGDAVSGVGNSGIESLSSAAPAMYSAMLFNQGTTVGDIHAMTTRFRADNNAWRTFRGQAITTLRDKYGQRSVEYFSAIFSDNFDEEKRKNWLGSFGVTESTNSEDLVYEYITNTGTNAQILNKYLEDNGLKITEDSTKRAEFDAYIREKNESHDTIDVDELELYKNERFVPITPGQTNQPQQSTDNQTNQPPQTTETPQVNQPNNGTNPQAPENGKQKVEIKEALLKSGVESGLKKVWDNFSRDSELGKYTGKIDFNKIMAKSSLITSLIKNNIIKQNGNAVTLDLSDNNVKIIYNGFFNIIKDAIPSAVTILFGGKINSYNRDGVQKKIKKEKEKLNNGKSNDYNLRKSRVFYFTPIIDDIIPIITQSTGKSVTLSSNGGSYSTAKDAFENLNILK